VIEEEIAVYSFEGNFIIAEKSISKLGFEGVLFVEKLEFDDGF